MMVPTRNDFRFLDKARHFALKHLYQENRLLFYHPTDAPRVYIVNGNSVTYREMIDCKFQDQRISSPAATMLILDS